MGLISDFFKKEGERSAIAMSIKHPCSYIPTPKWSKAVLLSADDGRDVECIPCFIDGSWYECLSANGEDRMIFRISKQNNTSEVDKAIAKNQMLLKIYQSTKKIYESEIKKRTKQNC